MDGERRSPAWPLAGLAGARRRLGVGAGLRLIGKKYAKVGSGDREYFWIEGRQG